MKAVCAGVLAALTIGAAAAAGETELRALVTANDSRGWEAVGRIDIGGEGFCTGALIAPDVVLTAAHCLYDPADRSRVDTGDIQFLAGWRNGRATAYRKVRHAVTHPDYVYDGPEGSEYVAEDIALLKLDQPIRNGSVVPFETARKPRKGAEVGVVSYARHRATRPSLQEVCHVLGRPGGTLVLSCDVDFGSSGAPVFVIEDGAPRIVSVISAKADIAGRPVSLGTSLALELPGMRAALEAAAEPGGRVADGQRSGGGSAGLIRRTVGVNSVSGTGPGTGEAGAKFLRP